MNIKCAVFLLVAICATLCYSNKLEDLIEREVADEFLNEEMDAEKRFLYTGKEQRREVKERYEEKCKRSIIHRSRPRWCPELSLWPEWNKLMLKDGVIKYKPSG